MTVARNPGQPGKRPAGIVGLCLRTAPQEQGRVRARMPAKKASELDAGISGRTENRGIKFGRHQVFFKSKRSIRLFTTAFEAYLSIIVHKYASIVNGIAELSSRNKKTKQTRSFSAVSRRAKPRLYET